MSTYLIRSFAAHEWPVWRDLRLAALADAPYAFSVTLADAQARGEDAWAALLSDAVASPDDLPLLAEYGGRPAGLAWVLAREGIVNVYQVWVTPADRGRGIARALLAHAIGWARDRGAAAVELGVTMLDTPAVRLYRRLGFEDAGPPVPMGQETGLWEQPMRLPLRREPG